MSTNAPTLRSSTPTVFGHLMKKQTCRSLKILPGMERKLQVRPWPSSTITSNGLTIKQNLGRHCEKRPVPIVIGKSGHANEACLSADRQSPYYYVRTL